MRNYYGKRRMGRLDEDLLGYHKAQKKAYNRLNEEVFSFDGFLKHTVPDVGKQFDDDDLQMLANRLLSSKEYRQFKSHVEFRMRAIGSRTFRS